MSPLRASVATGPRDSVSDGLAGVSGAGLVRTRIVFAVVRGVGLGGEVFARVLAGGGAGCRHSLRVATSAANTFDAVKLPLECFGGAAASDFSGADDGAGIPPTIRTDSSSSGEPPASATWSFQTT